MKREDLLSIAIPKGRILQEAIALFAGMGIDIRDILEDPRRLVFELPEEGMRFMLIRTQDVPVYVEYGAVDMGIAGKDVLYEQRRDLYEPLDLGMGRCRMVVAEPEELKERDNPSGWTHLKIATKYPNIATEYFLERGIEVEIIKLYGSIELAPLFGLSERIVDLVQTGETLRKNGLVEVETIMEVTAKLVCNRASLKTKPSRIKDFIERLRGVVEG